MPPNEPVQPSSCRLRQFQHRVRVVGVQVGWVVLVDQPFHRKVVLVACGTNVDHDGHGLTATKQPRGLWRKNPVMPEPDDPFFDLHMHGLVMVLFPGVMDQRDRPWFG